MSGAGVSFALALLAVAASGGEADKGWVRPEKGDLQRVLGVRWTAQIADPPFLITHPEQWSSPYITRDHARMISATTAGRLEARALANGELLWRKDNFGSLGASMSEHRGALLVSSGSNLLSLDDQTGNERWKLDIQGGIGGEIVFTGTVAIVPVRSNSYVAVDAVTGELVWRAKRPTPEGITMRGQAAAAIDPAANRAYLGFSDGALMAVSLSKGDTIWTANLGKAGQGFADIDSEPILDDNNSTVIAASYSGGLFKLEAATGRVLWKKEDLSRIIGLVRAGQGAGVIVASHGDGQALGLDSDGTVRWRYKLRHGSPTEPIYLGRGFVLFGASYGALAVLDSQTGKPVQLINPGSGVSAPPVWRDPDLAILTNKGLLLAIRFGEGAGI